MNNNTKEVYSKIKESLDEIVTNIKQEKDRKNFNHFVETGEVLPEDKDLERKSYIEALGQITSIVRPGPLSEPVPKIDSSSNKI